MHACFVWGISLESAKCGSTVAVSVAIWWHLQSACNLKTFIKTTLHCSQKNFGFLPSFGSSTIISSLFFCCARSRSLAILAN